MTKFFLSLITKNKANSEVTKISKIFERELEMENPRKITENLEIQSLSPAPEENSQPSPSLESPNDDSWVIQESEGELSVDIYQANNNIIVRSTIAGVKPEDIHISLNNDMLTIKGKRVPEDQVEEQDSYYRECYWGNFSRTIILPCEVKADQIEAKLKSGVLTVVLPKLERTPKISVILAEEDY